MPNQETFEHIKAGTRLWNGAIVTPQLADTYNSLQDRMTGFVGVACLFLSIYAMEAITCLQDIGGEGKVWL